MITGVPIQQCIMTTSYEVKVAQYACDDGCAEWVRYRFDNAGDAQECIDQLDGYEEYELVIHRETDDEIPF